eukprot:jgi/Tetstr1/455993/TSEL_042771.t1
MWYVQHGPTERDVWDVRRGSWVGGRRKYVRDEPLDPLAYPGLFTQTTGNKLVSEEARKTADAYKADTYYRGSFSGSFAAIRPPSARRDVTSFLCLPYKNGSTRWKTMLIRAAYPAFAGNIDNHLINVMAPHLTKEQAFDAVADRATIHMMWVRNPYARLLSAFLDKVLGKFRDLPITAALGGPFEDSPSEFARFVRGVLDARSRGVVQEVHWQLQTETCGLSEGVKYHFYLKEEEVNTWYVELMSLFGLDGDARPGPHQEQNRCFYRVAGRSCQETASLITHHMLNVTLGLPPDLRRYSGAGAGEQLPEYMVQATTTHARNAHTKLGTYYSTREVIADATEYLRNDLREFGYPVMRLQ